MHDQHDQHDKHDQHDQHDKQMANHGSGNDTVSNSNSSTDKSNTNSTDGDRYTASGHDSDHGFDSWGYDLNRSAPVLRAGVPVFDTHGERIGTVVGERSREGIFLVGSGFIFRHKTIIPLSVVQAASAKGVLLNVTREQIKAHDWEAREPSPTYQEGQTERLRASQPTGSSSSSNTRLGTDRVINTGIGPGVPSPDDAAPLPRPLTEDADRIATRGSMPDEALPPPHPTRDDDIIREEQQRME